MEVNIRNSTVPKMLELCRKHKEGRLQRSELEELLNHEDYQLELERYNKEGGPRGGFSKEEFVELFMNIFTVKQEEIHNTRLKSRYGQLMNLFENLEHFENQAQLVQTITREHVLKALQYTYFGLPDDIRFAKLDIIISISMGPSGGWYYKDCSQYDLVQFFNSFDLKSFIQLIAHESHHIGMRRIYETIDEEKITPEEYLYLFLSGEGLAIKYCNNADGVLTKSIFNEEAYLGYDEYTVHFMKNDFMETYKNFRKQIQMCRSGEIKTIEDITPYLMDYWMGLHTPGQDKSELPKLAFSRNYSFGCEIWGLIHDVYGSWKVFELLKDLKDFPAAFNAALEKIGRTDLKI